MSFFYNGRFTRFVSQGLENKVLVLIWTVVESIIFYQHREFLCDVSLILNNHWAPSSHRRFNAVSVVFLTNWITLYNKEVFIPESKFSRLLSYFFMFWRWINVKQSHKHNQLQTSLITHVSKPLICEVGAMNHHFLFCKQKLII